MIPLHFRMQGTHSDWTPECRIDFRTIVPRLESTEALHNKSFRRRIAVGMCPSLDCWCSGIYVSEWRNRAMKCAGPDEVRSGRRPFASVAKWNTKMLLMFH